MVENVLGVLFGDPFAVMNTVGSITFAFVGSSKAIRAEFDVFGITIVGLAMAFADYLIALKDGSVYEWGPPADRVTEQFIADVFIVEATVEHDANGGPSVHPKRPLSRMGPGGGWAVDSLPIVGPQRITELMCDRYRTRA